MKYLIDTHILLWLMLEPQKLSNRIKNILENIDNILYVSNISLWEIAIKIKIGKLNIKMDFKNIFEVLKANDFKILNLCDEHISETLFIELHHRDPFDRMLIAQAKFENLIIITKDANFKKYDINILW
ncbi:MAG: hypothetical protein B6I24_09805 [Bacteroidetes bacterium 4572_128]|nr:MAG: hypothetical protein B6I24_09805 [Bacteroidetes bacterium 4572_128]